MIFSSPELSPVARITPLEALSWMYLLSFCASRMITPVTRPSLSFSSLYEAAEEGLCTVLNGLVQVGFHYKALLILAGRAELMLEGKVGNSSLR